MFRKPKEIIKAPAADRKELAWLEKQLKPAPVAPELMDEEPEEVDESEAISRSSDEMGLDESPEDEQQAETSSLEEFEPDTKKIYRGYR
jgi:hypothetical protein